MKKLLTSLSTFVLVVGSVGGIATWTTQQSHQQFGTTTQKTSVANETAQQIADKIKNKTIQLDPSFWVGQNIRAHEKYLASLIVKQGLLTQAEVKYVFWGYKVIEQARSYPGGIFTVIKDGQTVKAGNITLDASYNINETAAQIAAKLRQKIIQLDPFFWLGKQIADYPQRLRAALVQQGILNYKEAHYINWGPQHFVINQPSVRAGNIINVTKNGQTVSAGNVTIDVRYPNETAQQIAAKLQGKTIELETNFWVNKDVASFPDLFKRAILRQGLLTEKELGFLSWGHLTIRKPILYSSFTITVSDFGSSAKATNIKLDARPHDKTAHEIAQRFDGKVIRLDPAFWVGKKLWDYPNQFRDALVQQGFINGLERSAISWPFITVSAATMYRDFFINVSRYGQVVLADVALDVRPLETAKTITKKLQAATILLNPGFWLRKDVFDYQSQLNDALVQQGILTRREVQYVTWDHTNLPEGPQEYHARFNVNHYGTATGETALNVSTKDTAKDIGHKLQNAQPVELPDSVVGTKWNYASGLQDNIVYTFRNAAVQQGILGRGEAGAFFPTPNPYTPESPTPQVHTLTKGLNHVWGATIISPWVKYYDRYNFDFTVRVL